MEGRFAYSISDDVLPAEQIGELIRRADEIPFVQTYLRARLAHRRRNGSTQAALVLEELAVRSREVEASKVAGLVKAIFAIADELDVEADRKRGLEFGNNELRIHWLVNAIVTDRFNEQEREAIYAPAMKTASVSWRCDFARRCVGCFEPDKDGNLDKTPIVSEPVAKQMQEDALASLRAAAADGTLIQSRSFAGLLFQWMHWTTATEVRDWTNGQWANDAFVIALANAVTSVGWTHGMGFNDMGDRVAMRSARVDFEPYADIADVKRLDERIAEIGLRTDLSTEQRQIIELFESSPRGSHRRRRVVDTTDGDES